MPTELYLIRHGETEWSLSGAHTSRTDIPLTGHGRRRAEELRDFLKGTEFQKVFTSPMQRARETAQIAGFGEQAIIDEGLKEWDYGIFEGKTTKEIRAEQNNPNWSVWTDPITDGESIQQVGTRVDALILRILAGLEANSKAALFAHAHILRIVAARWIALDPTGGRLFALGTGSLSILGYERDTRVIVRWNREFE